VTTINTILGRLNALDIAKEAVVFIESIKEDITELNSERMRQGRKADGSIMPYYNLTSVNVYGKEPGPIKLLDTGSFQEQIFVDVKQKSFVTDSKDSKSEMLKRDYGEEIFGLDKPERMEIAVFKKPVFVKQVRAKIL